MLRAQQLCHILGKPSLHGEILPCDRMAQGNQTGVEGRPGNEAGIFHAVEPVSGQGVAQSGHVDTELVGAAGPGNKLHQCQIADDGERLIVGHCVCAVGADTALDRGALRPADG